MAIEFKDVLDSTQTDPNVTNAVKRQGGLEISDTTGLQNALDSKSNTDHTHTVSDVTDFPTTMPPSAHTHPTSDISDWPSTFPPSAHTHPWDDVTGKPTEYPPAAHTHSQYELTLGNPAENNQVKLYQSDGSMSYVDLPAGGSNPVWGDIGGTLSNQTDLQAALDAKSDTGHSHTLADISDAGTMAAQDDAPSDGTAYARQDATWVTVPAGGTVEWGDIQGDITAQTDLMDEFDTKSDTGHTHTLSNITDAGSMASIDDAPSDGSQYARQDGAWTVVTGGGGGIPEAPSDGTLYGRKDAAWASAAEASHIHTISDVTDLQTELDAKLEVIPNATDTVVGGIKVRLDSGSSTVYITTTGETP